MSHVNVSTELVDVSHAVGEEDADISETMRSCQEGQHLLKFK